MIIKEFRIPMPMTLEEYQKGQIYSVAETSRRETGGGDGCEVITNEPFHEIRLPDGRILEMGQYTFKKYYVNRKAPVFVRLLTPKGALELKEESWNAFPYSKTVISNDYLGERLLITIESTHLADRGDTENALNLSPEKLQHREVTLIDIGENLGEEEESRLNEDEVPRNHKPTKVHRGPLDGNWIQETEPIMTCYKVVTCEFKIFGLQSRLENFVQKNEQRVFSLFHRRMFCWLDQWIEMTIDETRQFEKSVAEELIEIRAKASFKAFRTVE